MKSRICLFLLTVLLYNLIGAIPVKAADDIIYYHCDALGTPVALTNAQGNVVWTGSSLPFGEEFSGTGTRDTEIRYAGKSYNDALGLYDFGGRYYDPSTGRFTGVDPVKGDISNPQRLNAYSYGLNSPYKYVDPDGRDPVSVVVAGSLGSYFVTAATVLTITHVYRYNTDSGYRSFCNETGETIGTGISKAWTSTIDLGSQAIDIMFSRPADKAGGQFEVISKHLANITGSPMGGFDPDPKEPKKPGEGLIKHWKKEIRSAIENIKKLGLSEKQLMRDLQKKGFTNEQIQQVTSTLTQQGVDASGLPQ